MCLTLLIACKYNYIGRMPVVLALVGATGIGKSRLSLELAKRFDAQIVGVDSRQIYKGFAIGTAQPSAADMESVRHHLVNFVNPECAYSAGDFCRDAKAVINASPEQNFILVGGTGMYLQSLLLGLPQIPRIAPEIREQLQQSAEQDNGVSLYEQAQKADPESMANVERNNVQRIVRILEVFLGTGRKLSEWQKERVGGIGKVPTFWLTRNRENLYARIDARVDQMMRDGWMEEIHELAKRVPLEAPAWQSLGYRELLAANSSAAVARVLDDVKRKTRNYAKRQLTWFRWQMECTQVDLETVDNPFEFVCNFLK